jgi:hypothetical protein
MNRSKKTRKQSQPRKPLEWPPKEWPEEARQAEIKALDAFMAEWWKFVLADTQFPPTAEIIPFPKDNPPKE